MKRNALFPFFPSNERGQGLVEYALILVLVAIVVIAVLLLLGPTINQTFCRVTNALQPGACGAITGFAEAKLTGGGVLVKGIAVKEEINVTVSAGGQSTTMACPPPSCNINVTGVTGSGTGTITTPLGDYHTFKY